MTSAANARITALAADRALHRAFHWLHLHEPQIARWHRELLAIPAPPFAERPRAEWFAARFAELGLAHPHLDAEGNALAELPSDTAPPTASRPVILLSAHLDTIFPAGTPCTPREEDGRLLCPGATDNGAGLAALLALAAALRFAQAEARFAPAATILFAANVGEEGEGNLRGMRHLFTAPPYAGRIAAVIALEGAGAATVVDRALGSRRLRVEITGPGGHSWADAGRPNPINALAAALAQLTQLNLPAANPRTTLNCGTIAGGTSVNSIPASVTADLDLRSTSADELESLESLVLSTLSRCVQAEARRARPPARLRRRDPLPRDGADKASPPQDALAIKVHRIGERHAGALAPDSPLALSLRAVDRHLNLRTDARIGSTDANLPLSLGIPALAIGAGGDGGGIHTLQEWYSPEGRELALRRILLLLLDTCALYSHATVSEPDEPHTAQHPSSRTRTIQDTEPRAT